jgi:hypothetical protein
MQIEYGQMKQVLCNFIDAIEFRRHETKLLGAREIVNCLLIVYPFDCCYQLYEGYR